LRRGLIETVPNGRVVPLHHFGGEAFVLLDREGSQVKWIRVIVGMFPERPFEQSPHEFTAFTLGHHLTESADQIFGKSQ
jgi:hypothetical protein